MAVILDGKLLALLKQFPQGIPLAGDGSESISASLKALTVPVQLSIRYEIVTVDGQPTFGSFDVNAVSSRVGVSASSVGTLPRGVLVAASVDGNFPTTGGAMHVQVSLKRSGSTVAQLMAGYCHRSNQPTFPYGRNVPMQDYYSYPGNLLTQSGTAPAPGAEIADTVPSGAIWRLSAIEVALVTSAAAANRLVNFIIDDAQATKTRRLLLTDTTAQTATLTRTHGFYPGTDTATAASVAIVDGAITLLAKFPMSLQGGILLQPGAI